MSECTHENLSMDNYRNFMKKHNKFRAKTKVEWTEYKRDNTMDDEILKNGVQGWQKGLRVKTLNPSDIDINEGKKEWNSSNKYKDKNKFEYIPNDSEPNQSKISDGRKAADELFRYNVTSVNNNSMVSNFYSNFNSVDKVTHEASKEDIESSPKPRPRFHDDSFKNINAKRDVDDLKWNKSPDKIASSGYGQVYNFGHKNKKIDMGKKAKYKIDREEEYEAYDIVREDWVYFLYE